MERGAHIIVNRGAYYHEGIDLGDGTVIHFSGEPFSTGLPAKIRRCSFPEFLKTTSEYQVVNYASESCYSPDVVVQNAFQCLGLGQGEYNPFLKNCEHFATYCKTGQASSPQVQKFAQRVLKWSLAGMRSGSVWGVMAAPLIGELVRAGGLTLYNQVFKTKLSANYQGITFLASFCGDARQQAYWYNTEGYWFDANFRPLGRNGPQAMEYGLLYRETNRYILYAQSSAYTLTPNGSWVQIAA
jgi:hypothetical protein